MYESNLLVATAAKAREQACLRGIRDEHFYTVALSSLPLETAAGVPNRFQAKGTRRFSLSARAGLRLPTLPAELSS